MLDSNFCKKIPKSDEGLRTDTITPNMMRTLAISKKDQLIKCASGLNTIGGISTEVCDLEEISTNEGESC